MRTCIALFASLCVSAAAITPAGAQEPAAPAPPGTPTCAVADDPDYGWTSARPAQVGGGPMYGAARERRFIEALRGPDGQRVAYKRLGGATFAPDKETILDTYLLTYEGLEKPVTLYLDWYNYVEPKAPKGFQCGQPMNLGVPPADPFRALPQIVELAIEDSASREAPGVPFDAGHPEYGAAYDYGSLISRAARAATGRGQSLSEKALPSHLVQPRMVLVAFPLTCDGRVVAPKDLALVTPRGDVVPRDASDTRAGTAASLLAGVSIPEQSVTAVYGVGGLAGGLTVRITYDEPACSTDARELSLPVQFTPAKLLESISPPLPSDARVAGGTVTVQAVIDERGAFRRGFAMGGPPELSAAALASLASWRAEPARVNGVATPMPVVILVTFKPAAPQAAR